MPASQLLDVLYWLECIQDGTVDSKFWCGRCHERPGDICFMCVSVEGITSPSVVLALIHKGHDQQDISDMAAVFEEISQCQRNQNILESLDLFAPGIL
ncbi:uncharacterized protein LOC62_03G003551 [Vanrija pseudolonga]|uniref:Uncharacterized protein n=1 Tax=Vanrija pseudolonga TaxID=143232 RepID=A0AAF1BPY6_9TREE|nr:hypothetical protein LOC62_03G003551 [Vanrija pseudolonga]